MDVANEERAGAPSRTTPTSRRPFYRDGLLALAFVTVLALDQLTKYLVRSNLTLGESWPARGWVRLTHGVNSGTAFGLFPNQTTVLIVASVIAIGFLFYFYRTHAQPAPLLRAAIGLQLGGAFGNLADRIRSGVVVDFVDVGPWPIFNVADSAIVVGITMVVAWIVLAKPRETAAPSSLGGATPAEEPSPAP